MKLKFYIKERHNPQFKKPYYVALGMLTKKEAKNKENSLYGENYILSYNTEEEYNNAINNFKDCGYSIM
jgi:hypothetical protein